MAKQQPTRPLTVEQRQRLAEQQRKREADRLTMKRLQPPDPLDTALNTSAHPYCSLTRLHDTRRVDGLGAPELREVVIRHLDGDAPQRERVKDALFDLKAMHRRTWLVVQALIEPRETPSVRVLAVQLNMSKSTVHRAIVAVRHWLEQQGIV